MADDISPNERMSRDSYGRIAPLRESYVVKGGVNLDSQIKVRPPAPANLTAKPATPPTSSIGGDKSKV